MESLCIFLSKLVIVCILTSLLLSSMLRMSIWSWKHLDLACFGWLSGRQGLLYGLHPVRSLLTAVLAALVRCPLQLLLSVSFLLEIFPHTKHAAYL